jgi:hypothetical protein
MLGGLFDGLARRLARIIAREVLAAVERQLCDPTLTLGPNARVDPRGILGSTIGQAAGEAARQSSEATSERMRREGKE